jgi:Protein of unknown function (DUF1648)
MINRATWNWSIAGMWLVPPLLALRYWQVWDRLPVNIASHFNAAGRPNGWMTREGSLLFVIGISAFIAMLGTLILTRVRKPEPASIAVVGFFYVILSVIFYGNESVLAYNLHGEPVSVALMIFAVLSAVVVLTAIVLLTHRGQELPSGIVIAEEVHSGRGWLVIFLLPLIIELPVIAKLPNNPARIAMVASVLVLASLAVFMWNGFHYVFTGSGLEIRMLGFRLRSIPSQSICVYRVDSWNVLGGYGIRGLGDRKAYVFGNRGVRITTSDGEVFLGHSEPERIIRDLDAMKGVVSEVRVLS